MSCTLVGMELFVPILNLPFVRFVDYDFVGVPWKQPHLKMGGGGGDDDGSNPFLSTQIGHVIRITKSSTEH